MGTGSQNYCIAVLLSLIVCLINPLTGMPQTPPDAGLWTTLNMEVGLNSKFTLLVTEEIRAKENFSRLNLFYTNIGLDYKVNKNLKTNFVYRSIEKLRSANTFSYRHRIQWDITIKQKYGNFDVSYRHRLQAEVRNVYSSDAGYLPEWYSRNKFQVKYDTGKPWTPYAAIELRYQLRDPRSPESDHLWHRARYQSGFDYKINMHNAVGAYYLIQNEFNILDPEDLYIVGVEYSLKL